MIVVPVIVVCSRVKVNIDVVTFLCPLKKVDAVGDKMGVESSLEGELDGSEDRMD